MPWDEIKPRQFAASDHDLYSGHLGGEGGEPRGRFAELVEQEFRGGLQSTASLPRPRRPGKARSVAARAPAHAHSR